MEIHNFLTEFLNELSILSKGTDIVVWVGMHPWITTIYQFLDENGIKHLKIVDNSNEIQGKEIWTYERSFAQTKVPFKKINIEDVKKFDDSAIYLMANTHEEEIRNQLNGLGVKDNKIFNLYRLTRERIRYEEIRESFSKNHKELSLNEVQEIEMNLLVEFRNFCEDNHLRYFLGGGTLIGAVRHKGFIPWDDDIDVYMPYEDYRRFLATYRNHDKFEVLNWRTVDDFPLQFAQLVDNTTCLFRPLEFMNSECITNVFIDVFPISGYPSNTDMIEQKWNRNLELDAEWFWYQQIRKCCTAHEDVRDKIETERHEFSFDDSDYVGNVIRTIHRPWAVRRSIYDKTIKLEFGGEWFDAPIGYKEYLEYRYGNYMLMPPVYKREQHLFPTYNL